jgi:adenylate cyclase
VRPRSFRSRIVAVFLGLLTLAQAAGFLAASVAMTRGGRARIRDELAVGAKVFTRLVGARTQQLADAARLLSGDFAFKTADPPVRGHTGALRW